MIIQTIYPMTYLATTLLLCKLDNLHDSMPYWYTNKIMRVINCIGMEELTIYCVWIAGKSPHWPAAVAPAAWAVLMHEKYLH